MSQNLWGEEDVRPDNLGNRRSQTPSGHSRSECISTLIKCLRRGYEERAMYFAFQLEDSSEYLWRRLVIFAMEDVGLADPDAIVRTNAMRDAYFNALKDDQRGGGRLAIAQAVLYLCRTKKNRLIDLAVCTHFNKRKRGFVLEVPDYAFDMHNYKGRSLGRSYQHFASQSSQLNNAVDVPALVKATPEDEEKIDLALTNQEQADEWLATL